jgi:class 3 adenylate cyclase/tetratricopeptide (TPR) repeat protein
LLDNQRADEETAMDMSDQEQALHSSIHTFLIADLRGYTRFTLEQGDEAAASLSAQFAALARQVVEARGGKVIELRGDEVLAVFSSARQALRASVELQQQMGEARQADPTLPPVGIGLDAGEAVPVEDGYRGAALNLAARLCSLAGPGEVLVSETVVHLARKVDGLTYTERGAVQLKGFADAVRVVQVHSAEVSVAVPAPTYLPISQPSRIPSTSEPDPAPIGGFLGALPDSPLVARDEELSQVLAALDQVAAGDGKVVLLAGEPGVGKTRLAQEVTLVARNRCWFLATGRCYQAQQSVAYYPFLEALSTAFRGAPAAFQAEVLQRWPDLLRLLPDQNMPQMFVPPQHGVYNEQQRLFWAISGFVLALAREAPVVIALDDLQWADEASLALLEHLARQTHSASVLILGAYRDVEVHRRHPLEATLRTLGREHLVERVAVRRMSKEGTAALIAATMDQMASAELADVVHERTEGNPFFTQEVLRVLAERREVRWEGDRWERSTVEDIAVPESIRSAIGERVARLDSTTQEILSEASVLGHMFSFADLRRMSKHHEEAIEGALGEAIEAGLVRERGRDGYAFHHVLIQQALYAELSARRRQRLHHAAGEAIEQLPGHDQRAAELVWHFLEGDAAERALPYALQAGDQAEKVYAHGEAQHHYQTALELAREIADPKGEAQAREQLGKILNIQARYDEAFAMLDEAAALFEGAGDIDAMLRVTALLGNVYTRLPTTEVGVARLETLVARFSSTQAKQEHARGLAMLWTTLARLYYTYADRPNDGIDASERAVEFARATADPKLIAQAEMRRGTALIELGRYEEGIQAIESALPMLEAGADLSGLCAAYSNLNGAYFSRGELEKERRSIEQGLLAAERLGDPAARADLGWQRGAHAYLVGEWRQARADLEAALALLREIALEIPIGNALCWLGALSLFEGQEETAGKYFAEALTKAGEDILAVDLMYWALAERDLLAGDPLAARARLTLSANLQGYAAGDNWTWQRLLLAWALGELGELDEARAIVDSVLAHAAGGQPRFDRVEALRVQALLARRQGTGYAEAEAGIEEALAFCRAMPYPHQEVRLLHAAGLLYAQQGKQELACERFRAALDICERLGERFYAPRIERELAAVACKP